MILVILVLGASLYDFGGFGSVWGFVSTIAFAGAVICVLRGFDDWSVVLIWCGVVAVWFICIAGFGGFATFLSVVA